MILNRKACSKYREIEASTKKIKPKCDGRYLTICRNCPYLSAIPMKFKPEFIIFSGLKISVSGMEMQEKFKFEKGVEIDWTQIIKK